MGDGPIDYDGKMRAENRKAKALAKACLDYDAAIQSCANEPGKMSSFCSAEGDDLDTLYAKWLALAEQIHGKETPNRP